MMRSDIPPPIRLDDYKPPAFLIDHVDLHICLDGASTQVRARFEVRRNPAAETEELATTLTLNADGQTAVDVMVDGERVAATLGQSTLSVPLPMDTDSAGLWAIDLSTVLDPAANSVLSGLYLSNGVYCTQCEAEGFRRIIPFLDRPDCLATYRVTLDARRSDCPVLLSNGNLEEEYALDAGWHRAIWHDPHPKPSYLFAAVGGHLDHVSDTFTTAEGRSVALTIYVEPGKAPRAGFAMEALQRSMRWDEQRFGRVYDLDVFNIVAVADFNLGAMENKGLNIFNDKYILASPETATDEDYQRIDAIIAHEYFHNWSGNRVTCRDWFQLCLKEGLTVYRDQEYTSDTYDRTVKRIVDARDLWTHQFPEDAGPLAHPVRPDSYREINNFYTVTVYEKGAEIVRLIANWLGPERFRRAMDRYFARYDGAAVRVEEFLDALKADAQDLGPWPEFLRWYTQAGTPRVEVSYTQNQEAGHAQLRFLQKTPPTPGQDKKLPLPVPCSFGLIADDGTACALSDLTIDVSGGRLAGDVFLLEEAQGAISMEGLPNGRVRPSLFRDYSAPVKASVNGLDLQDRLFLAGHDSNAFNRWSELQSLMSDALIRRYKRLALGEPLDDDSRLMDALVSSSLASPIDQGSDQSLRAATLTLPAAQDIAQALGADVQPNLIDQARAGFSQDFLAHAGEDIRRLLTEHGVSDNPSISPEAASRRSLITALLHHLAMAGHQGDAALIESAYDGATGMTMRVKAMSAMLRHDRQCAGHRATRILDDFARRFSNDPLVMDKWFAVQAQLADAEQIEELETHATYDRTNPNRVRSLLGVFANGNLSGFHASDGYGYRLLQTRLVELDAKNPQLAARLANAFRSWAIMAPPIRQLANEALSDLAGRSTLSTDLRDIVTRCLDQ